MGTSDADDPHLDEGVGWSRDAQEAAEAESPPRKPVEPAARAKAGRKNRRLTLTLVSIAVSGLLAFLVVPKGSNVGFSLCTVTKRLAGANIEHAGRVVAITALLTFVATIAVRNRPRLLASSLLLMTAALTAGIVLVAKDSATWRAIQSCGGLFGPSTPELRVVHVWFLCVFWGATIVVLLSHARRVLRVS